MTCWNQLARDLTIRFTDITRIKEQPLTKDMKSKQSKLHFKEKATVNETKSRRKISIAK
jgi:hypothetical protein